MTNCPVSTVSVTQKCHTALPRSSYKRETLTLLLFLRNIIQYMVNKLTIILIAKKIITSLIKLILAISLLLITLWLPIWYKARPINNFCNSLTISNSYQNIISKAQHFKYRVYNTLDAKSGTASVVAENTPFFSMACVVTIENNIIVKKEVWATD